MKEYAEEDENGVVHVYNADGSLFAFMGRQEWDAIRKYKPEPQRPISPLRDARIAAAIARGDSADVIAKEFAPKPVCAQCGVGTGKLHPMIAGDHKFHLCAKHYSEALRPLGASMGVKK